MSTIKYKYIKTGLEKILLTIILMLIVTTVRSQEQKTLIGRVVNEQNEPVVGAVLNVSESNHISLSDKNGNFILKNVSDSDQIFVTCMGYLPASATADFTGSFQINMTEDTDIYAHTVPVLFTRKPFKFVTEAISSVSGAELEKYPITVLQNALTSTVTGVATYEAQSEPGWSETDIYIRGIRTMNSGARAPLIMVDNVERDLSFLDAFPIESITIVKDAASNAIYGMRGANGVVLVTTKRGTPGKTNVNFTQEFGYQTLSGLPESQNAYNYALTVNQAAYLDGKSPVYSDEDIYYYKQITDGVKLDGMLKYKYFNTNWHDVMLRDAAPQNRTNINISGGNTSTRYFISFSYLRQEGLFDTKWTDWNDGYSTHHELNRFNLRSNVDIDVNKFLNVSMDLGGRIDNITQPGIDQWNLFTWGAGENLPIYPVFCPNGEFFMPTSSDSKNGAAQIAGRGIEQNRRRNLYTTVTATGDLSPLVPGLKAKMTVSFDAYETFQKVQQADIDVFYYNYAADISDPTEYTYQRMRTFRALPNPTTSPRDYYSNLNLNGGLEYNHVFGKHSIAAQTFIRSYENTVRGQNSSNRYLSYNGQATYVFNNRYIFSGNISYMGCDNYAPGEQYATFPGASVGWVLSEEAWLKHSIVDLLKLRASYGKAGQSITGAPRYPYQGTYALGSGYNFGTSQSSTTGTYEATSGNRNIKWEISKMANLGVDFDLWKKKIYGSVDVFKEWRSNILVARSTIPTLYGVTAPNDSYGKAESKGIEVTLGHKNHTKKFNYYIEGMITINTNKITEMDELTPTYDYQARTGNRIDEPQLLVWKQWASDPNLIPTSYQDALDHPGKYPWHSAGQYKLGNAIFQDTNGDRIIDGYDKVPMNYTNIPQLIPSVTLGFDCFGFDARMVMTAYLNRTVGCRENMDYGFGWGGTSTHAAVNTWGYYNDDPTDPRNINAKYPRLSGSFSDIDRNYPYNESTIWVVNGNFLSLRNIEVGYSLPKPLIAKINMTQCRFYFSGYNLATWSHLPKGFDPENPTNYIWAYPKTKTFSIGVNIGF